MTYLYNSVKYLDIIKPDAQCSDDINLIAKDQTF